MNLLEALAAIQMLVKMSSAQRLRACRRILSYFFLNPMEIISCPFLQGQDCLIYENRFFGCRAYGLWSRQYYDEQAERSRQAKLLSQKQWKGLGVTLPQPVVDFRLPYCPHVEVGEGVQVDDAMILHLSDAIENLSGELAPWHDAFNQRYFSDLSFLLATLTLDMQQAVQLKFEIVRDVIATGDRTRIDNIVDNLSDFLGNIMT
jgi:Fe-S-cluster containining protein